MALKGLKKKKKKKGEEKEKKKQTNSNQEGNDVWSSYDESSF